jgi:ribosomal protein S18 acetylase RimI-like enzyme
MKEIRFRTLTIEDYDSITRLWSRAQLPFKPKGRDSRKAMQEQMQCDPEFFLGAFDGEQLVGVVVGSHDGRKKGWINRLAVHPLYRRRGIAQKMVVRMENILKEHGAQIFCSLIEEPNQQSIKFFKKIGYETPNLRILYMTKRESEDI